MPFAETNDTTWSVLSVFTPFPHPILPIPKLHRLQGAAPKLHPLYVVEGSAVSVNFIFQCGLRLFLAKSRKQLILTDLICYAVGVPLRVLLKLLLDKNLFRHFHKTLAI